MCAILDCANVGNTSVGTAATLAGKAFLDYVSGGGLKLLLGGQKLRHEIAGCSREFQSWLFRAVRAGHIKRLDDHQIDVLADELHAAGTCESDDQHLVALACVSGARLIFTNDRALQRDCKTLLTPVAKIYTTNDDRTAFTPDKRNLLSNTVCPLST